MEKYIKEIMVFLSLVLMVSVIYSKFVLSLSIFGFVFLALFYKGGSFSFWKNHSFSLVSLFFLLFMFSGINSHNTSDWIHHMTMRLPFLALPLAFYKLPAWNKRELYSLHFFFISLLFISSFPVLFHIVTNFDEVFQNIARGQPIDTPVNHVKYSIFMAFGIVSGIVLYSKKYTLKYAWEPQLLLIILIYLVVFLHILAVRSGIFVFYISLLVLSLVYYYKSRSLRVFFATLVVLISLPLLSYNLIPSLNKRIQYMVYDINEYVKNGGDNYSDSDRINSLLIGMDIVKDNPLVGVGIGDIKDECTSRYRSIFGREKYVLFPHNQYLFIAAATGILGLIIFLAALWGPLISNRNYQEYLFLVLIVIYSSSFFVDNLMERSFSAAFFAFFLSSCLSLRKRAISH